MNNIIENIELIIERFTITSQWSWESMLIAPVYNAHFFVLKKVRKLRCVLYTESFVLDLRPSLACKQIHEICPYTIICF